MGQIDSGSFPPPLAECDEVLSSDGALLTPPGLMEEYLISLYIRHSYITATDGLSQVEHAGRGVFHFGGQHGHNAFMQEKLKLTIV
jgi:hypothetical protein